MEIGLPQTNIRTKRHYGFVMAFAVVVVFGLVYIGPLLLQQLTATKEKQLSTQEESVIQVFDRVAPMRLSIPALSIETTFVPPLGLEADQTVMVPDSYTQVGWYKHGATPGEVGSAVVLGHVDSLDGQAVFYSLGQLLPGDDIEIMREDGRVAVFTVTELRRFSQDDFPTEMIYGATDMPTLRLVTCSGSFDRGEQRYSHNLVVFAELKI